MLPVRLRCSTTAEYELTGFLDSEIWDSPSRLTRSVITAISSGDTVLVS